MFPFVILAAVLGGLLWGRYRKGSSYEAAPPLLRVSGALALVPEVPVPPSASFSSQDHFQGLLRQGQLYRLWLRVDPRMQDLMTRSPRSATMTREAFLSQAMKPIASRLGFDEPLLVTHDPTDASVWCLLARWGSPAGEVKGARYVTPLKLEAVEEPPVGARSTLSRGASGRTILDEGLTDDEVWAVIHALARDDDTKHLGGFASTFDPDYPVAAGLLRVKSMLAAIRSYRAPHPKKGTATTSTALIGVLRKASEGLNEEIDRAWGRYEDLPLDEGNQRALAAEVKALGSAHVRRSRGQAPSPILITPAALQLAYSTRRPEVSQVASPEGIGQKLRAIGQAAKAGDLKAKEAQAKLGAANRYLERLQWVEWYKRTSKLSEEEGPVPGSLTGVLTIANRPRSAG